MIRSANKIGTCGLMPDATLLFDIDPSKALGRATQQGADRLEAAGFAFQRRVREAYLRLAEEEQPRMRVVDATGSVEVVSLRAKQALADILSL
jgi:dTMP kinase